MVDNSSQDAPGSPIAQLLKHLGMTREDLQRHSSQMREFLTAENASFSRILDQNWPEGPTSGTPAAYPSRSRASSFANASTPPPLPHTPVKSETAHTHVSYRMDSMEAVIERKSKLNRKEKRVRKEKTVAIPHSPTPSHSAGSLDYPTQPRVFSRAHGVGIASSSRQTTQQAQTGPYYPYPHHGSHYRYGYSQYETATTKEDSTALPSSSPPPSSPQRSSSPLFVNTVSSPGPPIDDDEDLPYTIPPGPYPDEKPELSYAALVGQAILSSKDHRLSLQHIYEWISVVYPYFKRSDQTWMNSIRHVLSTTVVFRKMLRGANKSQWAIWDQDLPCFANGGFDRKLCADMNRRKSKAAPAKRKAESTIGPAAKRQRGESPTPMLPFQSRQMLPHVHSNPHLQPYYASYSYSEPRTDRLIPLLPPLSNSPTSVAVHAPLRLPANEPVNITPSKSPILPASSASLVPSLTPSFSSSSSPPLASRDTSFQSTDAEGNPSILDIDSNDAIPTIEALEPSVTLLARAKQDKKLPPARTKDKICTKKCGSPSSPTSKLPNIDPRSPLAPSNPPNIPPRPCTPPRTRTSSTLHVSATLTPLSYKGLKMSPSPSLVHYKTHLDPPPFATYMHSRDLELARTPSRKSNTSQQHQLYPPVTPRKLAFQFAGDSPFRTPSRAIFDPHDPGALLDEELNRFGDEDKFSSPVGLFDKTKGLLYESPGIPSPGKWSHW